jgi:hypothetical protein
VNKNSLLMVDFVVRARKAVWHAADFAKGMWQAGAQNHWTVQVPTALWQTGMHFVALLFFVQWFFFLPVRMVVKLENGKHISLLHNVCCYFQRQK